MTQHQPKSLGLIEKAAYHGEIRRLIGLQLKAQYDSAEPISDRLAELLNQLALREDESKISESAQIPPRTEF